MRTSLKLVLLLLAGCNYVHAQVEPEATGGRRIAPVNSNFDYSARYSQSAIFYSAGEGNQVTSSVSADLSYTHPSERFPLTLRYGGGYMWTISGPSLGTGIFQHLLISQTMLKRRWSFNVSDNVSYTPEAPTTGFSGVPGTGEPTTPPNPTNPLGESILTLDTRTINNFASGTAAYALTRATDLAFTAGSELLRFPDGNGLNSDGLLLDARIGHRVDARNSISGQYAFSRYTEDASSYTDGISTSFDTNSITFSDQRTWNRHLNTSASVGPEWISGSDSPLVPATATVMVNASATYQVGFENIGLNYSRGINGGAGYIPGGSTDNVNGVFSRIFARDFIISLTGSYMRTAGLQKYAGATNAVFGGSQATKRLGRYLNVFAAYTAVDQVSGLAPQTNILNQLYQVITFGIGYSPREMRLRP